MLACKTVRIFALFYGNPSPNSKATLFLSSLRRPMLFMQESIVCSCNASQANEQQTLTNNSNPFQVQTCHYLAAATSAFGLAAPSSRPSHCRK